MYHIGVIEDAQPPLCWRGEKEVARMDRDREDGPGVGMSNEQEAETSEEEEEAGPIGSKASLLMYPPTTTYLPHPHTGYRTLCHCRRRLWEQGPPVV